MFIRSSEEFLNTASPSKKFVNPLQPLSSDFLPKDREQSYRFAEEAWYRISKLRTGIDRMIGYMVTEVEIDGVDRDKREKWESLIDDRMNLLGELTKVARSLCVYNNSFTSLYFPFTRYLQCRECGLQVKSKADGLEYEIDKEGKFHWECIKCGFKGEVRVKDRIIDNPDKVNVIHWNPKQIEVTDYNCISGDKRFFWKIPDEFKAKVKKYKENGFTDVLPLPIIEAAMKGHNLKFNDGQILHLTRGELPGVEDQGVGISPFLSLFPEVFSRNLIKRFNEVVGLDYMYPTRIYTPASRPSQPPQTGADPLRSAGMQGTPDMVHHLKSMVAKMRQDPTSIFTAPFEIREGTVGGMGINLLSPELLEHEDNGLLAGVNIPVEMREANLQAQFTPEAMRTMERSWGWLLSSLNTWLKFLEGKISRLLNYAPADLKLAAPSVLDDLMRRNLLLQLYQQGEVSQEAGLSKPWGINLEDEKDNMVADVRRRIEIEKAIEEESMAMEATQMLGQPPMPPPGGGQPMHPGVPMTPGMPGGGMQHGGIMPMAGGGNITELSAEAEHIAQQLSQMDEYTRRSQMIELSKQNEELHALVKHKWDQMKQQVDQQGKAMARQDAFG